MNVVIKDLLYNIAQLMFIFSKAKIWVLEWGRGTGKSTIIGRHLYDCVVEMPRSTGAIVGATYAQIKTRTLPSTIQGLEQHGIYKDKHYFIGRRPPKEWDWPEAYQAILDPTHCIFWWNGAVTVFISLDGGASSGRGLNIDWAIGDEAALFDEAKFNTDVLLTIRGNLHQKAIDPDGTWKYYKDCDRHHSLLLATSTPLTPAGQWVLKYEAEARKNPAKVKFISAAATANLANLGSDFFKNAKATMASFLYDAEVLNKRITRIKDGFYPKFNEKLHCYDSFNNDYYRDLAEGATANCQGDADHNEVMPLIIGIDWGANINCLVAAQQYPDELRVLKNFFVTSPQIIDDLIEHQFHPYYKTRKNKVIYFWYDASGNVSQANSRKTYAEQVMAILRSLGWTVRPMTRSNYNEKHDVKYRLMAEILQENNPKYPRIRMNRTNCRELIISIVSAPAKAGTKSKIQKDKRSEKSKVIPQEHATHFSDTFDVIVVGMFVRLMTSSNAAIETRLLD